MPQARILLMKPDFSPVIMMTDLVSGDFARNENTTGSFTVTVPMSDEYDEIGPDWMLELQRSMDGGTTWENHLYTVWFIRLKSISHAEDGSEMLTLSGHDSIGILDRRIIAYFGVQNTEIEQDYYSIKYKPAADIMREIVRENCTDRILSVPSKDLPGSVAITGPIHRVFAGVSVQANTKEGASVLAEYAWSPMQDALRVVADAALDKDVRLIYDMVYRASVPDLFFQVWTQQRGADRNSTVVFSLESGNLNAVQVVKDFTTEATWAHVGGEGQASQRLVVSVQAPGASNPMLVHLQTATIQFFPVPIQSDWGDYSPPPGATWVYLKTARTYWNGQTVDVGGGKLPADAPPVVGEPGFTTVPGAVEEVFERTQWYPIEIFVDGAVDKNDESLMEARGRREIRRRSPRWVFTAQALDVPWTRFGRDYGYGDIVGISYRGQFSTCRIKAVRLRYEKNQEFVEIPLESQDIV